MEMTVGILIPKHPLTVNVQFGNSLKAIGTYAYEILVGM